MADAATDATDATDAAEVDEADLADEAADATETTEANQADVVDKPVLIDDAAYEANEADEAIFAEANKSLANGIAIVLYSLTKYCEVFAKDEGYFVKMISNNQLVGMVWSCSRSPKCQHLQRADTEDGKLLSFSMRVRLCFVHSLQM